VFLPAGTVLGRGETQRPSPAPSPLRTDEKLTEVVARLERHLPQLMKDADVPGLGIGLLRDGKLVWHRAFGVKNSQTNELVDDTTVFEAASLSKPVFAYAVLKLVDEGKFDIDKPLNQYLPGNELVGGDTRLGLITARRVLSHTTGLPNWRGMGYMKIHFTPGERFSYSGEGMVYLSKVIEHVTGEPFNDFMKRKVFSPLGMVNSSYVWEKSYEKLKTFRHNGLGQPTGKGQFTANAAASLHTTVEDYGRFIAAMVAGTGLKPETRKLMLTPQIQVREGGAQSILRPDSKTRSDIAWGLGWGLQTTGDGLSFWHWGDNGNSKAFVVVFDKPKLGVVVFANSANGLSIMREIVADAVGGAQPALDWLDYESYDSPRRELFKQILARGNVEALREYLEKRREHPAKARISENQMNNLGFELLALKHVDDALAVFKQNVTDHPESANVYDSLAELYEGTGAKGAAIANYKKSLELNPKNENAVTHLKKLQADDSKKTGK
jgi:CubicO group peptidase (beta-lactamase class C family)